jgi:4-hydroxybenzoate polyprenyltransferase
LLAAADDPVDHLGMLFGWQIERTMTSLRAMTAGVGAILVALIAALLGNEQISPWLIALVGTSVVLGMAYSQSRYKRAQELEAEYVVALGVLRELAPLTPLIRLWPDIYVD